MITRFKRAEEGLQRQPNPPEDDEGGEIPAHGGELISGGGELHNDGRELHNNGGEEPVTTLGTNEPSTPNPAYTPHSEVNSRLEEGSEDKSEAERASPLLDLILAASRANSTVEEGIPTNQRENPQIPSENPRFLSTAHSVLGRNGTKLGTDTEPRAGKEVHHVKPSDRLDSSVLREEGSSFPIVLNERPSSIVSSISVDTKLTSTRVGSFLTVICIIFYFDKKN